MRYLLLVLVGCSSTPAKGSIDATVAPDAFVAPPCDNGQPGVGTGLFRFCGDVPAATVSLSGMLDTSSDSRCILTPQHGGPMVCVIAASQIEVGDTTVVGDHPLVLVASDSIRVTGTLDASSSNVGPRIGAGAIESGCASAMGTAPGNAGGAGGSFGTTGGSGGSGTGGEPGGTANPPPTLADVRAGCPGETGGGDLAGAGGPGGGGLYLIAGTAIAVTGSVFASGAGGAPTRAGGLMQFGGAGGGGAGGMIGLEAPMISVDGTIAANGGGGGMGDGVADHTGFGSGADGTTVLFTQPAAGAPASGVYGHCGQGDGGNGGAMAIPATAGTADRACPGGGGGGGGSVGIVWVRGSLTGTKISPPPSVF